jgi:hypothetical protein
VEIRILARRVVLILDFWRRLFRVLTKSHYVNLAGMASVEDKITESDRSADNVGKSGDSSPREEQGQVTPGVLHIPETRDGFFGYNEEKNLQHVSARILALSICSSCATCID